jgi:transcriptional regulator with GAF, ATPase, and Fis domain
VDDIPLLVNEFVKQYSKKVSKDITKIPGSTMETLKRYPWPGNIRELQNVIERSVINTQGTKLQLADQLDSSVTVASTQNKRRSLKEIERESILRVLEETSWRIEGTKGAATILGLNPSTLRGRMRKFGIRRK